MGTSACGPSRVTASWSSRVGSSRTGVGGESTADRSANRALPSGLTTQVGVRAGGREPDDGAAAEIETEDRRAAALVGEEVEERAVGGEHRVARPGGRVRRQHLPGLVGGEVEHLQRAPRGGVPVAERLLQVRQAAPSGEKAGSESQSPSVERIRRSPLAVSMIASEPWCAARPRRPATRRRPSGRRGRRRGPRRHSPSRRGQVAHGGQPPVADRWRARRTGRATRPARGRGPSTGPGGSRAGSPSLRRPCAPVGVSRRPRPCPRPAASTR